MRLKDNIYEVLKFVTFSFIIGVILFFMAEFSPQTAVGQGQVWAFHIPAGLSIGVLVLFGVRFLPIILLVNFILGMTHQHSLYHNLINCAAGGIEAYVGCYLYKSFRHLIDEFFEYQSHLAMVILLGILAPIFSALISVTNLYYMGVISEASYFTHFLKWYSGSLINVFVFLPAFIAFTTEKHRVFDFFAPFVAIGFTLLFRFEMMSPYVCLLFLTILVPAICGSVMGIYYSLIAISCVLNWFLVSNVGPFSFGNDQVNMLSMQFFLLAISIMGLSLEGFKRTNLLKSALVPFISFWLIAAVSYYHYHTQKDFVNENIVEDLTKNFSNRLIEKMTIYENSIKGAGGFIIGSEFVTKDEWEQYIKSISVVNDISGIKGIGVLYPPTKKSKSRLLVYPEYLNFKDNFKNWINQPEVTSLLQQAIDRDAPLLSSSIAVELSGGSQKLLSFLVSSVKKDNQLIAWIIAPIEMGLFFKSMAEIKYPSIDVDIFDGEANFKQSKIYSKIVDERLRLIPLSHPRISRLSLANHTFTIDWNQTLRYVTTHSSQNSLLILLGSILSVIFTTFFLNLKLISVKENKIADNKTFELRESEEKFKSLFENSSDAVILFNAHKIIDCNPESLDFFGKYNKDELINTPLYDFFSLKDLDSSSTHNLFEAKVREVKYKKIVKFECFFVKSGLPFFVEMNLHYIEVNDKFIYQAVVRDISERKKIEQSLTKSKELAEDAGRAKSNFLSAMSHEIRTPLNGVLGMINSMLDDNPSLKVKEGLETIKYSADNLLHVLNEVLDYSKIESGKITLEKKSFNLRELCESVLKVHKPKAFEKKIRLILEIDPNIPEKVIGDDFRNTQILNNFLSNWLKFTDSGEIVLSVLLKQKKENACSIEFKITDSGIDKNKTGLGLAITKRLVEIQNGRIEVVSNLNQGSSFAYTIDFNIEEKAETTISKNLSPSEQEGFSGQRILLVEDNEINIIVTKKFLEKWGLRVDVAINGFEAINHARSVAYDLILMDLHMPQMDGFEATKKIREFNKDVPIIGLSADVMTESLASLQAIGMNDFVTKPFRPNIFFIKLKSYF